MRPIQTILYGEKFHTFDTWWSSLSVPSADFGWLLAPGPAAGDTREAYGHTTRMAHKSNRLRDAGNREGSIRKIVKMGGDARKGSRLWTRPSCCLSVCSSDVPVGILIEI